jgi:hypothetical protein
LEFGDTALGYHGGFGFLCICRSDAFVDFHLFSLVDYHAITLLSPNPNEKPPDQMQGPLTSQLPGTLLALTLRLVGAGSQLKKCQGCG